MTDTVYVRKAKKHTSVRRAPKDGFVPYVPAAMDTSQTLQIAGAQLAEVQEELAATKKELSAARTQLQRYTTDYGERAAQQAEMLRVYRECMHLLSRVGGSRD